MSESHDDVVLRADEALRDAVALAADDHLDLAVALAGASAVRGSVATAFERRLKNLMPAGRPPWLDPLLSELARLQADQFVTRAALARHGEGMPAYRDALLVLRELLVADTESPAQPPFKVQVDLSAETLGYGWHQPERSGTGPWYRWSGPVTTSGLLVPTAGAGDHSVTLQMQSRVPGNIEGLQVRVNGAEVEWTRSAKGEQTTLQGVFTAAPDGAQRFFALLEWEVPRCAPLSEFGANDQRRVGFVLHRVVLERWDSRG